MRPKKKSSSRVQCNAHLTFDGQCEAAFRFYAQCLGGKVVLLLTFGNSPMADRTPPEWHGRILHATLVFGDQQLTGADAFPNQYRRPQGFNVLLHIEDTAEAERIFAALADKGTVEMPIAETFWARRFGMVVDRFGTPWMINCGDGAQSRSGT
jgi:PhnB protein